MIRLSYLAAPLFLLAYGAARLIDGRDGVHGPGPAWTIGHLLFLAGLLAYAVVLVGLYRIAVGRGGTARILAGATLVAAYVGLAGFVQTVLIDLWVGLNAADRAGMSQLYDQHDGLPILTTLGPLFQVGLLILLVRIVLVRRGPWWSPVALLLGNVALTVNLDLLPVGALLFLAALAPFAVGNRTGPTNRSAPPNQRVSATTRSTPPVLG